MNQLQTLGGTERISTDLVAELSKHCTITTIIVEGTGIQYYIPPSVTVRKLSEVHEESSRVKKVLNTFKKVRAISKIIKEYQPDAVLSFLPRSNMANILAKRFSKMKHRCVIVEHNFSSINYQKSLTGWLFLTQMKRLYPKADIVIPNAYKLGEELVENFYVDKDKVKMIANPYRIEDIVEKSKESIEEEVYHNDGFIFINVARFIVQKNLPLLLEAFHDVRKQRPSKLLLMGKGPDKEMLVAKIKELGLEADVILKGWTRNPFKYMKRANAFVLSSDFEGAPNVLYESMICETPIISTDCPTGPSEILEEGALGVLVPLRDRKALADAMLEMIDKPEQANDYAQKARQAVEKYHIKNIVKDYYKVLFD
ncbi:MAG: glycosyltransferase [Bacteroidota bacterium]